MTYITNVPQEVLDEIEHITSTLSCNEVFYSDSGAALILADDRNYIISVEPPDVILPGFNNGNCTTHSAYLITEPLENAGHCCMGEPGDELKGWTTGWEC